MPDLRAKRKAKGLIGRAVRALTSTPRERVAVLMRGKYALRVHTSILMLWTFSAGLLVTKGLYALGAQSLFWRYTVAILVGYAAFLLGVRIWLAYVGVRTGGGSGDSGDSDDRKRKAQNDGSSSSFDITDVLPSGRGSGGGPPRVFGGQGGGSGGAGASASFDAGAEAVPANLLAADLASMPGSGAGDSGSVVSEMTGGVGDAVSGIGDLGGDDGCLIAFGIMIVVALIGVAIGGAVFVISMGPEILIDAAFSAMLSGGLIKSGQKMADPDWLGSVMKVTWIPLAVVLVLAWVFAGVAASLTPNAHTFGEVWRIVWPQLMSTL